MEEVSLCPGERLSVGCYRSDKYSSSKNDGLSPSCADCQVVVEGRNMKNLSCNCRRKNGQVVNVQEILGKQHSFLPSSRPTRLSGPPLVRMQAG